MVKRNANHNAIRTIPLQLSTRMIAGWQFVPDAKQPGLIRQKQLGGKLADMDCRVDPFELRESFWRVKDDQAAFDFLNRAGIRWADENAFFLSDVFKFQEFTKQAVRKPLSKWQEIPGGAVWFVDAITSLSGILCEECNGGLCLRVRFSDARQVILAAVVVDNLERNRFRLCKKPGCGLPFKVGVRQKKQYCSEAHRQADAMRRVRRRQSRKGRRT